MTHQEAEITLEKQLVGEASAQEVANLTAHLQGCSECSEYALAARRAQGLLQAPLPPPAVTVASLQARAARLRRFDVAVLLFIVCYFSVALVAALRSSVGGVVPIIGSALVVAVVVGVRRLLRFRAEARLAERSRGALVDSHRQRLQRRIVGAPASLAVLAACVLPLARLEAWPADAALLRVMVLGSVAAGAAGGLWQYLVLRPRWKRELELLGA